jgi:hypothetical protein
MGYAYHLGLKQDVIRAAKRASGVDQVIDKIEELPVSQFDDDIRWKTYYAIYRDPFLSRYAPGGGLLWGHRHPFGNGFHCGFGGPRFPGMEPLGDYPSHIIVKNGRTILMGVVDNESDKTVAGMRAREVPGALPSTTSSSSKKKPRNRRKSRAAGHGRRFAPGRVTLATPRGASRNIIAISRSQPRLPCVLRT